jgi:hypothetical protein
VDHKQDQAASLDACLMEIRKADESVRTTTRRLGELRHARVYAFNDNEPDRLNT